MSFYDHARKRQIHFLRATPISRQRRNKLTKPADLISRRFLFLPRLGSAWQNATFLPIPFKTLNTICQASHWSYMGVPSRAAIGKSFPSRFELCLSCFESFVCVCALAHIIWKGSKLELLEVPGYNLDPGNSIYQMYSFQKKASEFPKSKSNFGLKYTTRTVIATC